MGKAYHKTGQYKKEKKLWQKADRYIPDDPSIIKGHAILSFTQKESATGSKYIERYISVMKRNSASDADLAEGLAQIYYDAGIMDKFEEYYRKAISLDPENPGKLNKFASLLSDSNQNLSEFLQVIDKAISLTKNKYDYCNYLDTKGFGLFKYGRHNEALEVLEKAWNEVPFKMYFIKSHLEEVKRAIGSQK